MLMLRVKYLNLPSMGKKYAFDDLSVLLVT